MKPSIHIFKKPVRIVQIFRNINEYGKEDKSFDSRKEKLVWKPIVSTSGHVLDQALYLPEEISSHPKFENCNLITLTDDNLPPLQSVVIDYNKNHCFHLPSSSKLNIFHFKLADELEVHFKYGYYEVGSPTREDFKIADLKKNTPISIKINGKIDARRQRSFMEQEYVFDYLGDFRQCFLVKDLETTKTVPPVDKVVDLMKPLW